MFRVEEKKYSILLHKELGMRPGDSGGHCTKSGGKISQKPFLLRFPAVFSLGYLDCPPGGPGLKYYVVDGCWVVVVVGGAGILVVSMS